MSHYGAYPKYKDSGIEWIGEVPEHWQIMPIKVIADVLNGATPSSSMSEYWDGDIAWYTPTDIDNDIAKELEAPKRYITQAGFDSCAVKLAPSDSVILSTRAPIGSIGITNVPSTINQGCRTLVPLKGIPAKFLASVLVANRAELRIRGNGTTFQELSTEALRSLRVAVPEIAEIVSITEHIEQETTRIDSLITKKTRFIELVKEKILAIAMNEQMYGNGDFERLGRLIQVISRPVEIVDGDEYVALGLYNRGRGLFHKSPTLGKDMGDSDFFYVEEGDLILSGQFAWEGAVTMASNSENGCVVSHRYPVLRGKSIATEYLLALLMTNFGDFLLNESSRGAAGRNRPLNINLLLNEKIKVPSLEVQNEVKRLTYLKVKAEKKIQKSIELLKERRSAFITAAVTGQIDLRKES